MTIQINLPDSLAQRLQHRAGALQMTLTELAIQLLGEALPEDVVEQDVLPSHTEIIRRIRALRPNPQGVIQPTRSVEQLLATLVESPPSGELFTFQEWYPLWQQFEEDLRMTTQADALTDVQREARVAS